MRILLISSNLRSQFHAILSNGAVSLSAYLKRAGHQVRVCHIERKKDWDNLRSTLTEFKPQLTGISVTVTETPFTTEFAAMSKRSNPDAPILVGGIQATLDPEYFLGIPEVSGVCRGEGEIPLLQ